MSVKLFLSFSSFFCITFIHDFRLTCCLLLQLISHWSLNKAVWSPKTRTHLPSWCAWVSTTAQQNKTSPRLLLLPLCCLKIFLFFFAEEKAFPHLRRANLSPLANNLHFWRSISAAKTWVTQLRRFPFKHCGLNIHPREYDQTGKVIKIWTISR